MLAFALWPLGTPPDLGPDVAAGSFQAWQLITYSLLHGSFTHLFLNMFALYMFGSELERLFGPRRYLTYWFAAVLAAGVTQLIVAASTGTYYPTVGASGGVFGLLLAYGINFPRRVIVLLIPPIPMPAWLFVIVYAGIELYLGVTGTQAGVAHFAHLGGMLGGVVDAAVCELMCWSDHRGWSPRRHSGDCGRKSPSTVKASSSSPFLP